MENSKESDEQLEGSSPPVTEELKALRNQLLFNSAAENSRLAGDLMRWTVGSLLVANGGAIVALLGSEYTREAFFESSGWFFAWGFLCAIVAGCTMALGLSHVAGKMADEIWSGRAQNAESASAALKELSDKHSVGFGVGFLILFASFFLFLMGCLYVSDIPADKKLKELEQELNALDSISS